MTRRIDIVEVGPRDGLQNEAQTVPTDIKVRTRDLRFQGSLPLTLG